MKARALIRCALLALWLSCFAHAADPSKTLRLALPEIDSLDPQNATDAYSSLVVAAIFEGLYEWDYLARSPRLVPNTALAMPEISDGGRTWTIRIKPGIYFTDDPAFAGRRRELVADDYVYSFKRMLDPSQRFGGEGLADLIVGARQAVDAASEPGAKFDYGKPLAGLRSLDRYTLRLSLAEVDYPRVEYLLAFVPAVAREVVDAAGSDIQVRAVGTGPYRLKEWKRGVRVVLESNPDYRRIRFPESADPENSELVRSMSGAKLPEIGTIEIDLIAETLPMILEFEQRKLDYIELTGPIPDSLLRGQVPSNVPARPVRHYSFSDAILSATYFNMQDPVIGGLDPQHIALRRAIALGFDVGALIKTVYGGRALAAGQLVPPGVAGHDPQAPAKSPYDPAAANALLDRFGYRRGADGYRATPDGKSLALTYSTRQTTDARDVEALWKKNMDAIGLRMKFEEMPFQDLMKEAEAGHFQIYARGFGGDPSGALILRQLYSKEPSAVNPARFRLADYDRAMEQFLRATKESERISAARTMSVIARHYVPMIPMTHRIRDDFVQPWLKGFHPSPFGNYWKYLDIDLSMRRELAPGDSGSKRAR